MKNKHLLLLLLSFLLVHPIYASDWEEIVTKKDVKVFLDNESVEIKEPKVYYWIKFDKDNYTYKMNMVSACKDNTTAILKTLKYDQKANLITTNSKDEYMTKFEKVVPDSVSEQAHIEACGIVNRKLNKWNEFMYSKDTAFVHGDFSRAEFLLREALKEAELLHANGFSNEYFVISYLHLADLYSYQNRYDEALTAYNYLYSIIANSNDYNKIRNDVALKVEAINKRKEEMQRAQKEKLYQQQQYSSQSQQNNNKSVNDVINSGFSILNAVKYGF